MKRRLIEAGNGNEKKETMFSSDTIWFTFTSIGEAESMWNLDGEIFEAHHLSSQVLHGLIPLFASGPEV